MGDNDFCSWGIASLGWVVSILNFHKILIILTVCLTLCNLIVQIPKAIETLKKLKKGNNDVESKKD